jgi:hypothetical protein
MFQIFYCSELTKLHKYLLVVSPTLVSSYFTPSKQSMIHYSCEPILRLRSLLQRIRNITSMHEESVSPNYKQRQWRAFTLAVPIIDPSSTLVSLCSDHASLGKVSSEECTSWPHAVSYKCSQPRKKIKMAGLCQLTRILSIWPPLSCGGIVLSIHLTPAAKLAGVYPKAEPFSFCNKSHFTLCTFLHRHPGIGFE